MKNSRWPDEDVVGLTTADIREMVAALHRAATKLKELGEDAEAFFAASKAKLYAADANIDTDFSREVSRLVASLTPERSKKMAKKLLR